MPLALVATLVGKVGVGVVAGRLGGFSVRQGINAGAALVAHGEFTIILAQLAAGNAVLSLEERDDIVAFAGLYVLASATVGVILMKESRRLGPARAFPTTRACFTVGEGVRRVDATRAERDAPARRRSEVVDDADQRQPRHRDPAQRRRPRGVRPPARGRRGAAFVLELHDDEARQLGALLGGAYERPKIVEELEMALGEFQIEWIKVPSGSWVNGRTLAECAFRKRTGVTVIAILRESDSIAGAQPEDVIQSTEIRSSWWARRDNSASSASCSPTGRVTRSPARPSSSPASAARAPAIPRGGRATSRAPS